MKGPALRRAHGRFLAAAAVWLAVAVGAGTADGMVALIVAGIMAATAISGFYPPYLMLSGFCRNRKLA